MGKKVHPRRSDAFRLRLVTALADAGQVLADDEVGVASPVDFRPASMILDNAITRIASELAGSRLSARRVRELGVMVGSLDTVRNELYDHRLRTQSEIETALDRLRHATTVEELFEKTPATLTECCGLDEVGLWSIENGQMKLVKLHCDKDDRRAAEITTEVSTVPLHAQLLETEVMRRRSGVLVTNSSQDPRVNADVLGLFGTNGHAIVPIMPEGKVIGFFHGGCYPDNRLVDALDFEALSRFARGFGHVLERVVLCTRMASQRDYFQGMIASGSELADRLANAQISLSASYEVKDEGEGVSWSQSGPPRLPPESQLHSLLTRRELEVLELMAAGHTNGEIAQELVVSVGTVKFHVRRILGKLHATNRAQAASSYSRIAAGKQQVAR
jgi:DNA-binding CsgD family transcriptional regulator